MGAIFRIIDFSQLYKFDWDLVGKKACQLGELKYLGIPIPDGFVITTSFFEKFLQQTGIAAKIREIQKINHLAIKDSIDKLVASIQKDITHASMPKHLKTEIYRFYKKLCGLFLEPSLNIFSSSPLNNKCIMLKNVKGDANLILKIKEIWASHLGNPVAIVVQKNINSKIKGKIFSNDILIENKISGLAKKIQKHFYFPQEIHYVIEKGKIYVTQVKPFTGIIDKSPKIGLQNKKKHKILIKGIAVNPGIVTGPAKIFSKNCNLIRIKSGEVIVLPNLDKSLYKDIKKAKGIVVDTVLPNSYALMLYRKYVKIPTILGAKDATRILKNRNIITIDGISGEIYQGGFV